MLSIDSATPVASVAVLSQDALLGEAMLNTKNTHSEKLLVLVQQLLDELALTMQDIDIIAVAQGPGSFTGLRIGMATAKGLAQGAAKKLIAVPTLDALAYHCASFDGLICPILNAKKNEVYTALYRRKQNLDFEKLTDDLALKPQDLTALLAEYDAPVLFLGDGVAVYGDILSEALQERALFAPIHLALPRAAAIGALAIKRALVGDFDDLYQCQLIYVRRSEAEIQWEKKHNQAIL